MKKVFERTQRVGDLIQKELAQMLLTEMSDERFRLVTITGVTVSRDWAYAKVYVSVLSDDQGEINQIVDALNHAAKSLRYHVAHRVKLRVMPELKFFYDESIARGFRIASLINKTMKDEEK